MVKSPAYSLRKEDVQKWLWNAFIFAIPALLVLLASLKDVIPVDASWGVVALYLVNVLTDLLKKWMNENRY